MSVVGGAIDVVWSALCARSYWSVFVFFVSSPALHRRGRVNRRSGLVIQVIQSKITHKFWWCLPRDIRRVRVYTFTGPTLPTPIYHCAYFKNLPLRITPVSIWKDRTKRKDILESQDDSVSLWIFFLVHRDFTVDHGLDTVTKLFDSQHHQIKSVLTP